ncbi:hypothetical protein [Lignipirellula cremea]|uniref:Uncharacterized protein n=1 Tax=Lignipirellula cremea TaxID=2528010 RepID=A0A518DVH1_9BACT|nr:hypothetical protein [Lignipirellula cremea]QDU95836.1 hypothetical protein Pla8534_36550 [Lignipirellula cremea]
MNLENRKGIDQYFLEFERRLKPHPSQGIEMYLIDYLKKMNLHRQEGRRKFRKRICMFVWRVRALLVFLLGAAVMVFGLLAYSEMRVSPESKTSEELEKTGLWADQIAYKTLQLFTLESGMEAEFNPWTEWHSRFSNHFVSNELSPWASLSFRTALGWTMRP